MQETPSDLTFEKLKEIKRIVVDGVEVEVERYLGKGSFGVVFAGKIEGKLVAIKIAIKVIEDGKPVTGGQLDQLDPTKNPFDHEYQNLVQLARTESSSNLPEPITMSSCGIDGIEGEHPVLIMGLANGENLAQIDFEGNLERYLEVMTMIGSTIDQMHRDGVADLDFATDSVFINPNNAEYIDLGLAARLTPQEEFVQPPGVDLGGSSGTFNFMSFLEARMGFVEQERDYDYYKAGHIFGFTTKMFQDLFGYFHALLPDSSITKDPAMMSMMMGGEVLKPTSTDIVDANPKLLLAYIFSGFSHSIEDLAFGFPAFISVYEEIKIRPLLTGMAPEQIVEVFLLFWNALVDKDEEVDVEVVLDKLTHYGIGKSEDEIEELIDFYNQVKSKIDAYTFPGELGDASRIVESLKMAMD